MKKNTTDILTTIGLFGGFLAFAYGVISGQGIQGFLQFIDIRSVFITIGGTFAVLLISVPAKTMKKVFFCFETGF